MNEFNDKNDLDEEYEVEEEETEPNFRSFVCVEENHSKFWKISVVDCSTVVRFGRIGNDYQEQWKEFPTREKAEQHREKMIREKTNKGYCEIG